MKNSKNRATNLNNSIKKCCEDTKSQGQNNKLSSFDWKNLGFIKMWYAKEVNLQY